MSAHDDPAFLFELRFRVGGARVTLRAFEAPLSKQIHRFTTGHTTLDLELIHGGRLLWPRGSATVGTTRYESVDGDEARALALSLFELKPGDTDAEFFDGYTPEQLDFVQTHSDEVMMVRWERFGEDS